MAKSPNGLGQFSGKLGGVVYAVRGGEQIVRAYQPVVSNPKSTAQLLQRAKGNVVGRLSAITPREVIAGLGSNGISRRSRFLKLALRNAKARFSNGEFIGSLPPDALILSEGSLVQPFSIVSALRASATADIVTFRLTRLSTVSDADWNSSAVMLVVFAIDNATGFYDSVFYRFIDLSTVAAGAGDAFNEDVSIVYRSGFEYFGYVIPMQADKSTLSTISSALEVSSSEYAATLLAAAGSGSMRFANSKFVDITTSAT